MPTKVEQVIYSGVCTEKPLRLMIGFDPPHASFCQQILDISMTQAKSMIEPNSVTDDFRRESVTFVSDHLRIIRQSLLTCQYPAEA